jgi:hypothetical protein
VENLLRVPLGLSLDVEDSTLWGLSTEEGSCKISSREKKGKIRERVCLVSPFGQ